MVGYGITPKASGEALFCGQKSSHLFSPIPYACKAPSKPKIIADMSCYAAHLPQQNVVQYVDLVMACQFLGGYVGGP